MTETHAKHPSYVARTLFGTCVVALILGTIHIGAPDAWVSTGAAAAMLLLPWALIPRDPGPALMGDWRRDLKFLFLWSGATFIPFALGFHLWFSVVMGMHLSPELSASRISRFQPELRTKSAGLLAQKSAGPAEVRIWERNDEVFVFVPKDSSEVLANIRPDNHDIAPVPTRRSLLRGKFRKRHNSSAAPSWEPMKLAPGHGYSFPSASTNEITIQNPGTTKWRLSTPLESFPVDAGEEQRIPRNLMWIPMMLFLHLIAVALPEEYFFRGFLQRILRDKLPSIKVPLLPGRFPLAIVVSSFLFALVHLIAVPHISRLAVFFPSLLFGWLYERSGNLSQPIGYHALSNVVLATYEMIWFG